MSLAFHVACLAMLSLLTPTRIRQGATDTAAAAAAAPAVRSGFLELPKPFVLGVATAAFQIEGSAEEGGRKPSIWDDFSRQPGKTANGATGDVACDHYRCLEADVKLLGSLGVDAYRFSISWSRLIPAGEGAVNPEGIAFYSRLIDRLLELGVTPWVTLYHWDFPSVLEADFGGWLGPKDRVVSSFGHYARTCFSLFGDRVKRWITINEPWCVAALGYGNGEHAPGRSHAPETEPYIVGHNLLLAHAEAVRIYRTEFAQHSGMIGMAFNAAWKSPRNPDSSADIDAAQQSIDFELGWFADPVYRGNYPVSMQASCGERLPSFTEEEQRLLIGSNDFFGINYYTSVYVRAGPSSNFGKSMLTWLMTRIFGSGGYFCDSGVLPWIDFGWEKTDMGWPIVPCGFRELLLYIHRRYTPSGGIIITENGAAHEPKSSHAFDARPGMLDPKPRADDQLEKFDDSLDDTVDDPKRVRYLRAHLSAVHAARELGADVRAYFCWSLMDNFEWAYGYTKRFGIIHVDFETQKRTFKASGRFLADTIQSRGFVAPPLAEQYGGKPF